VHIAVIRISGYCFLFSSCAIVTARWSFVLYGVCEGVRAAAECIARSRSEETQQCACRLLRTLAEGNPKFQTQVYNGFIALLPCSSAKAQHIAAQSLRIVQVRSTAIPCTVYSGSCSVAVWRVSSSVKRRFYRRVALRCIASDSCRNRYCTEYVLWQMLDKSLLTMLYSTTYYPNDVTMKLSVAWEIPNPSTQSEPAQINSTNLSGPTVWTTSHSHSLSKESRHLTIVNKQCYFYGCIVYGSARSSYLRVLDPVQNHALRLCLGAYRTSPSSSLCVLANEPPIYVRRQKLSIQL